MKNYFLGWGLRKKNRFFTNGNYVRKKMGYPKETDRSYFVKEA